MKEIIQIRPGQCANVNDRKFWETIAEEHLLRLERRLDIYVDAPQFQVESMKTYFKEIEGLLEIEIRLKRNADTSGPCCSHSTE